VVADLECLVHTHRYLVSTVAMSIEQQGSVPDIFLRRCKTQSDRLNRPRVNAIGGIRGAILIVACHTNIPIRAPRWLTCVTTGATDGCLAKIRQHHGFCVTGLSCYQRYRR
jgi:hypothetical protein